MNELSPHLAARVRELAARQVAARRTPAERVWATFPVLSPNRFAWLSHRVYVAYMECRNKSAYALQELCELTAALYWGEKDWTPADPFWIEQLEQQAEMNTYDADYLFFYGGL